MNQLLTLRGGHDHRHRGTSYDECTGVHHVPGHLFTMSPVHTGSASVRRVDERNLVITLNHDGKATATEDVGLSADLKRLTMTVHVSGRDRPLVLVFERQATGVAGS